jgi:penicillin V acylase-like amidase (Ntn superfamily)
MKRIVYAILVCVILAITHFTGNACTTFCIKDSRHLVLGRNFDFSAGGGLVIINKRNLKKFAYPIAPEKRFEWTSRYGSVTFNQMGKEFPYGGINEKGLVIELMWLDDTVYPEIDQRGGLTELQWIQYQLDNAATIDDILASDAIVRISKISSAPIHFLACDATGNIAAIEYLGGKLVIHTKSDLPMCALANDTYAKSRDYAQSLGVQKSTASPAFTSGSLDRFAQAATLVKKFNTQNVIDYSFDILNKVSQGSFTRWSIVYDVKNMTVYYKTQTNRQLRKFKMADFDFSCDSKNLCINMEENMTQGKLNFQPYTYENNLKTLSAAYDQVDFLKATSKERRELHARFPEEMKCE